MIASLDSLKALWIIGGMTYLKGFMLISVNQNQFFYINRSEIKELYLKVQNSLADLEKFLQ